MSWVTLEIQLREGVRKKTEEVWSFAKLGGEGVSEGSKKPNLYFGKVFLAVQNSSIGDLVTHPFTDSITDSLTQSRYFYF